MAVKNSDSGNRKHNSSIEKFPDNSQLETDNINWLSNNVPVTIFRTSRKLSWGMDFISKNVEKLTGYSSEDFNNKKISWFDIVFPEDIKVIEAAVKNAKKNKISYQIEYRIKKSDGKTVFVQEQANVVCDDKGEPSEITGVFLDFTEQKIQLEMLQSFVKSLSHGDIPETITDNYDGNFNEIKNNINSCIDGLQGLAECNNILHRMAVNDNTKGVEGKYVGIYANMAEATNLVRARVLNVTNQLNNISVGDSSQLESLKKIGKRSEQDQLLPAIIRAMGNVKLLIEDTEMLAKAGVEGKLDIRADASRHPGEFKKVVEGINDTLDAVIGPLNVAAEYVERISRGDVPQKITDNYNGDFNEIKNNLNNCIDGLQGIVECNKVLQLMAVNDHTKRVEGEYVGIFASMGKSTNDILNRLLLVTDLINDIAVGDISQLAELKKTKQRSEHDRLRPGFIRAMENIKLLIEDVELLSRASVEGKLDTRADATKHEGDFRKVVAGVNDTLDAVIGPLNVAAEYVERISRGDIPKPITDNYNGDFNEIKNNLNTCIVAVNNLVSDAVMLSEAGVAGKLDIRADASKHEGDFRKIINGFNDTLDAVIGPVNEAIRVSNEFSTGNFRARV
ncbi:MAG: methyl-accepting chemotaxis protein, partial [Euryarchaeota archaeon]|nr:methyl-accepting chemotaxis protein [Euryarchaeota archaeon]